MANIFSYHPHQSVPDSLSQCLKEDRTASDIRHWAEWIESIGQILVVLIGIIGSILTMIFFIGALLENVLGAIIILVVCTITFALICFAVYIGYHLPALIVGALASIVQSTIVSANVALFSASHEYDQTQTPETTHPASTPTSPAPKPTNLPKTTSWVCSACGTSNDRLSQSCTNCGKYR